MSILNGLRKAFHAYEQETGRYLLSATVSLDAYEDLEFELAQKTTTRGTDIRRDEADYIFIDGVRICWRPT
jgi:hypothetical protein